MQALKTLQNSFIEAVFANNENNLQWIKSSSPKERFKVYRFTIFENLQNALRITYPGIWTLLDKESADSIAYAFCLHQYNFPTSGCLDDWGNEFPKFLAELDDLKELPYLQDYACYEWNKHLAYGAAESDYISPDDLAAINEEEIEKIKMVFIPSVVTFHSAFPIDEIDEIVKNPNANAIDLRFKNCYALIFRKSNCVLTEWLPHDLWLFVCSLKEGWTLIQAVAHVEKQCGEFDLTKAISFYFKNN